MLVHFVLKRLYAIYQLLSSPNFWRQYDLHCKPIYVVTKRWHSNVAKQVFLRLCWKNVQRHHMNFLSHKSTYLYRMQSIKQTWVYSVMVLNIIKEITCSKGAIYSMIYLENNNISICIKALPTYMLSYEA